MRSRILLDLMTNGDTLPSRVVRTLAKRGSATPLEIANETGLARSTMSTLLADLRAEGLVVDSETVTGGMGRPSRAVRLAPESGLCAGVLLGLTEIRLALCDVSHAVLSEVSVAMTRDYSPQEAAMAVRESLDHQCAALGTRIDDLLGVGLAVSAPVSPGGVVHSGSILPTWNGVDIAGVFGPDLKCPVHAENESNCGALAEMMWGAAQGETDFVLFKCSLGIGGAIIANGNLLTGQDGFAGEFGHITLQPDGGLCRCGKRGCVEAIAGGARLVRLANEIADHAVSLGEIAQSAAEGHSGHGRLLDDAADTLGWAIGILSTTINPPLYVITGEMALAGDRFLNRLRASHDRHSLHHAALAAGGGPRFTLGRFVGNDTVLGAVALVLRQQSRIG